MKLERTVKALVACAAAATLLAAVGCGKVSDTTAKSDGSAKSNVVSAVSNSPTAGTEAPTTAAPTSTASDAKPTATSKSAKHDDIEIVEYGFAEIPRERVSQSQTTSYAVLVRNPNPEGWAAKSVSLNIAFYDAAGTVLKSESPTFSVILPGQTVATGDGESVAGVARMEVKALTGGWEALDKTPGAFTLSGITMKPQSYGGPDVTGLISSTFAKDIKSPKVTVVFRDAAGKAVGGAYTYADFVPAGGQAAFTVSPLWTVPAGWTTEGYAEITSLSLLSS